MNEKMKYLKPGDYFANTTANRQAFIAEYGNESCDGEDVNTRWFEMRSAFDCIIVGHDGKIGGGFLDKSKVNTVVYKRLVDLEADTCDKPKKLLSPGDYFLNTPENIKAYLEQGWQNKGCGTDQPADRHWFDERSNAHSFVVYPSGIMLGYEREVMGLNHQNLVTLAKQPYENIWWLNTPENNQAFLSQHPSAKSIAGKEVDAEWFKEHVGAEAYGMCQTTDWVATGVGKCKANWYRKRCWKQMMSAPNPADGLVPCEPTDADVRKAAKELRDTLKPQCLSCSNPADSERVADIWHKKLEKYDAIVKENGNRNAANEWLESNLSALDMWNMAMSKHSVNGDVIKAIDTASEYLESRPSLFNSFRGSNGNQKQEENEVNKTELQAMLKEIESEKKAAPSRVLGATKTAAFKTAGFVLAPAKPIGWLAVKALQYALFLGAVGGIGYGGWQLSKHVSLPTITWEQPEKVPE